MALPDDDTAERIVTYTIVDWEWNDGGECPSVLHEAMTSLVKVRFGPGSRDRAEDIYTCVIEEADYLPGEARHHEHYEVLEKAPCRLYGHPVLTFGEPSDAFDSEDALAEYEASLSPAERGH